MSGGKSGRLVVGVLAFAGSVAIAGATSGIAAPSGSADLSVAKSDRPDPVQTGADLTYTLDIKNAGPDQATNAVATDKLPKDVTFVSASSTNGNCTASKATVTCNLGTLGTASPDNAARATIQVKAPNKAGKLLDIASIGADQRDPQQSNNKDSETTTVVAPAAPQCGTRPVTILGTAGSDTLNGTNKADVIAALGGNDLVLAAGGKDAVCAGGGGDVVKAGSQDDLARGGGGADFLKGKRGNDTLRGGSGPDVLRGGPGDDLLAGGPGDDSCIGGAGRDRLHSC